MIDCIAAKQLFLFDLSLPYHPYWNWEDYKAGMFRATSPSMLEDSVAAALSVLGCKVNCEESMTRVITEWPVASAENLRDPAKNRRPWIGRACCCISRGVREDAVRAAWWMLSDEQRANANAIADDVIFKWELFYA